jgi:hypothetical protein
MLESGALKKVIFVESPKPALCSRTLGRAGRARDAVGGLFGFFGALRDDPVA